MAVAKSAGEVRFPALAGFITFCGGLNGNAGGAFRHQVFFLVTGAGTCARVAVPAASVRRRCDGTNNWDGVKTMSGGTLPARARRRGCPAGTGAGAEGFLQKAADVANSLGMTPPMAKELAEAFDETMGHCILALYRSAGQPVLAQWSQQLPAASVRPGLVVFCTEDIWSGGEARHRWVAEQTGAHFTMLEGLGYWWMLEDPAAGANMLNRFWDGL